MSITGLSWGLVLSRSDRLRVAIEANAHPTTVDRELDDPGAVSGSVGLRIRAELARLMRRQHREQRALSRASNISARSR
jgi:hypothetical protein